MVKKLIFIVLALSAPPISHSANWNSSNEHAPTDAKRYSDDDWNVTFVRACGALKSAPYLQFIERNGDKFARFILNTKDTAGQCKADKKYLEHERK